MTGAANCVQVVPSLQRVDAEQVLSAATGQWVTACETVAEACVAQGRSDTGSFADVFVPIGTVSFEPLIPSDILRRPSRTKVPVRVQVDGHQVGAMQVPIEWHALRPAWQIVAPIAAGQVVRRADVRPVRVDTRDVRGEGVVYDARTRLARATRALALDDVVVIDAESTIAEFRAGDAVPVVATIGNVQLTRTGTAVQDGRRGSSAFVRFADGGLLSSPVPREPSDVAAPSNLGEAR
jgi:flagella basal body P-ring formation protein FlgA